MRRLGMLFALVVVLVAASCTVAPNDQSSADDFRSAASELNTGVGVDADSAVAVSTGYRHACALTSTGRVACWGDNSDGQRGDGTVDSPGQATYVAALIDATAISAGLDHTCALRANATVACWGNNSNGQLGNGTTDNSTIPVVVDGIDSAIAVDANTKRTCALLADTTVRCWGRNDYGEVGNGTLRTNATTPLPVTDVTGATLLSAGSGHSCVAGLETVWCWGRNVSSELGNDSGEDAPSPVEASSLAEVSISMIDVDLSTSCALRTDGKVLCWGSNTEGQFGRLDPSIATSASPVLVQSLKGAVQVSLGSGFGCALDEVGAVQCWGANDDGQLGRGEISDRPERVGPVIDLAEATDIDVGTDRACAVYRGGYVACWGLGLGDTPEPRAEFSEYQISKAAESASTDLGFGSPLDPIGALAPGNDETPSVDPAPTAQQQPADATDSTNNGEEAQDAAEPASEQAAGDTAEDVNNERIEEYSDAIEAIAERYEEYLCTYGVSSDETLRLRDAPNLESVILTEMAGSRCNFSFDEELTEEFVPPTPTPAPTATVAPTPTPLPAGVQAPKVIGGEPGTTPTPTPTPDPLAGWAAIELRERGARPLSGWVSRDYITPRPARSVLDPDAVLGIPIGELTVDALDELEGVLGAPETDEAWATSCLDTDTRVVGWGNLFVEFGRESPDSEGQLIGARLGVEGPFIAGATIIPGRSTWGDLVSESPRSRLVEPSADSRAEWTSHDVSNRGHAPAYYGTFVSTDDGHESDGTTEEVSAQRRIGDVWIGSVSSSCE